MEFDLRTIAPGDAYRVLVSVVVPRPIAWVTTVGEGGAVNAAPFSFFNLLGSDPPILGVGVGNRRDGAPKDTARNALLQREFVVNLVDEASAERMNVTAIEFPEGTSEIVEAGLTPAPSLRVSVPRIAEAPVNLECRLIERLDIGNNHVLLGEVLCVRVRDNLVGPDGRILTEEAGFIARMHGGGGYARTSDRFRLDRLSLADWRARHGD